MFWRREKSLTSVESKPSHYTNHITLPPIMTAMTCTICLMAQNTAIWNRGGIYSCDGFGSVVAIQSV
jgi:hypothetical protein